jgi:hypothetical protein
MLKLALIAVERFKHCLAGVLTASIGVNRPIPEARYQHGTPQDTNGGNFVPKRGLTRYCNRTRDCSCNEKNMPEALLADFAPLGGAWCCFRLRLLLKGG